MKPITGDALDNEQKVVVLQLTDAVHLINQASAVMGAKGNEKAMQEAIARSLMAIAKVMTISKADELNAVARLPAFKVNF